MHNSNRARIGALYAIFFVSGFCGLIYESIWSHYLKLLLGHAAYAQAVVLVVFVGGLALGAWLTGRWSERLRHPLLWYAAAEALVALASFAFHDIFTQIAYWAVVDFMPAYCPPQGLCPANWLLAAALILPASVLLGTTFPLMSAGVLRLGVSPGRGLSLLYFLNSAGAAIGVLCSGFLLIPELGLPGTMLVAGGLNCLVAFAAYLVERWRMQPSQPLHARPQQAARTGRIGLTALLGVAALTGFSSFVYEVVWIRMLTLVLGGATHSFELMLSVFIMGLALGAWWVRKKIDSHPRPEVLLARVQIAMGVAAIVTLVLYAASFDAMAFSLRGLARSYEGYTFFTLASGVLVTAVMLPAAFCAGMTLPLITSLLLRRGHGERQIGQVYGVNTLGAIAGVLATVHLLMPLLGLKWTLAVGALVDVLLGLGLVLLAQPRRAPDSAVGDGRWPLVACALALAFVVVLPALTSLDPRQLASGVFRSGQASVGAGRSVLFHRDGKTATISVLDQPRGTRSLLTNGKSDGSTHPESKSTTPDDHTVVLLGALGPAHHPTARRAAVIGLGTGVTSAVLLGSPVLQTVDTIEIEPLVAEAAQHFRPRNAAMFDDPRSRLVIDDAKAHFARTPAKYDLIVSEPSNPWVSGVSGLFTVEFYDNVAAHLAPDGHFVQWLHLYEASPDLVSSILRAFSDIFPQFTAYATNSADIILVARNDGRMPVLAPGAMDAMPGMRQRLLEIGITSEAVLAAHEAGRGGTIKLLADSYQAPVNSDYHPYVDSRAAPDRFQGRTANAIFDMHLAPVPLLELTGSAPSYLGEIHAPTQHMPRKLMDLASAWHGQRYLHGETLTAQERSYLGSLARDYALMRAWTEACSFPADTDPTWGAAVSVASDLNRGLAPQMAARLWQDTLKRCSGKLTPLRRAWIELFGAAGARDAQSMKRWGDQVLASDSNLSVQEREFAALASIGARMALRERAQARQILAEQGKLIPANRIDVPWFRYVALVLSAREIQRPPALKPAAASPAGG